MWQALKVLTKLPVSPGRRSESVDSVPVSPAAHVLVPNESSSTSSSPAEEGLAVHVPAVPAPSHAPNGSPHVSGPEKRLTRSSHVVDDDPVPPTSDDNPVPRELRSVLNAQSPVLFALTAPPQATWHRLPSPVQPPVAPAGPAGPSKKAKDVSEVSGETWRLLPHGAAFSRSRHAGASADTSDEYYHKLHRYPEMLEKRSVRFERERLVHERAQLVLELDALKSRGYAYKNTASSAAIVNKHELERRKKVALLEERLKRYDVLLPDKAATVAAGSSASGLRSGGSRQTSNPNSRANSPMHSSNASVSASHNGGVKIKIKFGGGGGGTSSTGAGTTSNAGPSKRSNLSNSISNNEASTSKVTLDLTSTKHANKRRSLPKPRPTDTLFADAQSRDAYLSTPALQKKLAFGCAVPAVPSREFSIFADPTQPTGGTSASGSSFTMMTSKKGLDDLRDEDDDGSSLFTSVIAYEESPENAAQGRSIFASAKTFEEVYRDKKGVEKLVVPESAIRVLYDGPVTKRTNENSNIAADA